LAYSPCAYNKHANLSAFTTDTPSATHTLLQHTFTASAASSGSPTATRANHLKPEQTTHLPYSPSKACTNPYTHSQVAQALLLEKLDEGLWSFAARNTGKSFANFLKPLASAEWHKDLNHFPRHPTLHWPNAGVF